MAKGKSVLSNSSKFYAELHKLWRGACARKLTWNELYVKVIGADIRFTDEDGEVKPLFPAGKSTEFQTFRNAFIRMRNAYVKMVEEVDTVEGTKKSVPWERQDGSYVYGNHCPQTVAGTAFPELKDAERKGRSKKVLDVNHLMSGFDALDEDLFGDDELGDEGDE